MYRSSSWNRVSDDYSSIQSPPSSMRTALSFEDSDQQLPLYDLQIADMAKKERARLKFAENAVHLIPLVLILCALILWLFSTTPDGSKVESVAARIEGISIEGEIDNDSDGTQTGIIPTVDLRYTNSPRLVNSHKASKKMD